jgi:ElaB/YqjD/DUF883 family membrane-anchored ribosome-binding protein
MGQDPAAIEREIARKRSAIGSHIEGVQTRVRDDVAELRHTAEDQANATVQQTKSKLDISAQAREHPLSMLAGALGLGVVLGAASEGLPGSGGGANGGGNGHGQSSSRQQSNDQSNGMIAGMMTSVIGPAAETIRDELRQLVKEGFGAFKENSGLNQSQSRPESGSQAQRVGHVPPP